MTDLDCSNELNARVHQLLAAEGEHAPDYCGDDLLAVRALLRYAKRGVATGVYFGDLAAALDPKKADPHDCHLYRDRKYHKVADVHIVRSGPTYALAICRALVAFDEERLRSSAW